MMTIEMTELKHFSLIYTWYNNKGDRGTNMFGAKIIKSDRKLNYHKGDYRPRN